MQWSWNDSPKVHTYSLLNDMKRFKRRFTDDYAVVKKAHDLISQCDILVGHNIKGHDLKKLQAKIIEYKLPPLKIPLIVDTYEWSKKHGFTSRKMGDLCSKLGLIDKLSHDAGVFLKAAMGCIKSIKKIVTYGKGDIPTVRQLYKRLKPYAISHPNMGLFLSNGSKCCPFCQSENFIKRGFNHTSTACYQAYQCMNKECLKYFQGGKAVKKTIMR